MTSCLQNDSPLRCRLNNNSTQHSERFNFFCDIFLKKNSLIFGECSNLTMNLVAIEAGIIKFRGIWCWSIKANTIPVCNSNGWNYYKYYDCFHVDDVFHQICLLWDYTKIFLIEPHFSQNFLFRMFKSTLCWLRWISNKQQEGCR